nr:hypothetical protein [Tanacetum cinerariifolium]
MIKTNAFKITGFEYTTVDEKLCTLVTKLRSKLGDGGSVIAGTQPRRFVVK